MGQKSHNWGILKRGMKYGKNERKVKKHRQLHHSTLCHMRQVSVQKRLSSCIVNVVWKFTIQRWRYCSYNTRNNGVPENNLWWPYHFQAILGTMVPRSYTPTSSYMDFWRTAWWTAHHRRNWEYFSCNSLSSVPQCALPLGTVQRRSRWSFPASFIMFLSNKADFV